MADHNIAPIFGNIIAHSATIGPVSNLIDGRPVNQAAVGLEDYTVYKTDDIPAWVIIDLGEERTLSGFALWGSANVNGRCVKDYRIALDNNPSGSFANIAVDSRIRYDTFYFAGRLIVQRDYQPITSQSARYVKLFLDTNHGDLISIETMELEILGSGIQQDTVTVTSDSEIFYSTNTINVISDAYIVPAPIITETTSVTSNAEITDLRADILSDAFIAVSVYSNATIIANEAINIQSDAMVYRSGSAAREAFTMGKGSFEGFPDSGSTLIYCTNTTSSDEVVVVDMITSSIIDIMNIEPPLGYQNYDWKYDWVVRTYNDAQYKFEIRTGETIQGLQASTFSPIVLGQVISIGEVPRYYQWRCHIWASGSGDFELHQFSIKGYIDHPASILYSSLNSGEFTTVSKVETGVDKPYEPMDMDRIWYGTYTPGDANNDGVVDYNDALYITAWKYYGGPEPNPLRRADVNDDGEVNILDIIYLIAYLFNNGPPPYRRDEGGLE